MVIFRAWATDAASMNERMNEPVKILTFLRLDCSLSVTKRVTGKLISPFRMGIARFCNIRQNNQQEDT